MLQFRGNCPSVSLGRLRKKRKRGILGKHYKFCVKLGTAKKRKKTWDVVAALMVSCPLST